MLEPSHFHRTKLLQYLIFGPLRRSPIKIYFDCSLRWRLPLNLHSRKRNTVCDENGKSISCRGNKQMRTTTRLMHTDLIPLVPNRPTSDEKQLRLLMVFINHESSSLKLRNLVNLWKPHRFASSQTTSSSWHAHNTCSAVSGSSLH